MLIWVIKFQLAPNGPLKAHRNWHQIYPIRPIDFGPILADKSGCGLEDCSNNQYAIGKVNSKNWRAIVSTALAAAVVACSSNMSAFAELNKYEADIRGEFGIGSAAQFGSADLKKAIHVNENFRRANFTSADMRESDFSGSTFNGAYLEKAVAYKANFSGKFVELDIVLLVRNLTLQINSYPIPLNYLLIYLQ
ncbi:hypothetical protein EZV62_023621 [Acer yangbiense]|uniref:Pentapeptide repeat-containing protein n=1 Tax=Acer yangbiense TaxID=1000413 RepID=A0A5C7H2L5_9ROSI|nr:hypothetical protein EZV62_023621 [Acer yangbiense]